LIKVNLEGFYMFKHTITVLFLFALSVSANAHQDAVDNGLVSYDSPYSVEETVKRFEKTAQSKGLTLLATVNHQQNAQNAGLTLAPSVVIIFGNPKAGTPLMQCAPSVAVDLPQKVLISEASNSKVSLYFNDPLYLKKRHNIKGCNKELEKIANVLDTLAKETVSK